MKSANQWGAEAKQKSLGSSQRSSLPSSLATLSPPGVKQTDTW